MGRKLQQIAPQRVLMGCERLGADAAVVALAAAANLLWVRRRLARAETSERAGTWLRRFVGIEVALLVFVLLATGFLTSLEPARQYAARTAGGVTFDQTDGSTRVRGTIEPGVPGNNRVHIELYDRRGDRVPDATSVTVHARYLDVELGEQVATALPTTDGAYETPTMPLSLAGQWQIQVRVTRNGDPASQTSFEVT